MSESSKTKFDKPGNLLVYIQIRKSDVLWILNQIVFLRRVIFSIKHDHHTLKYQSAFNVKRERFKRNLLLLRQR